MLDIGFKVRAWGEFGSNLETTARFRIQPGH